MFQPFDIGDQVQLKKGWTPMIVRAVEWGVHRNPHTKKRMECWWIRAQYPNSIKWWGESEEGWKNGVQPTITTWLVKEKKS